MAKDFICLMLKKEPSQRLIASKALVHPWIKTMASGDAAAEKRGHCKQQKSIAFASRSIAFMNYRNMQKLKKAALGYLTTNVTKDDISALKDIFKRLM